MSCNQESNDKIVKNVPWKEILLSRKVHALWITHMCSAWGYYLLAISLPTFLEEVLNLTVINVRKWIEILLSVLHLPIKICFPLIFISIFLIIKNGFSSSLPYIGMLLFATSGKLFDLLRGYQWTSLTNLRKIFNSIGR